MTAVVLTVLAYALICTGLHPESVDRGDVLAPLLGVSLGCAEAARRSRIRPWVQGVLVGVMAVLAWLAMWCFLVGRLTPLLWWQQGIRGLTWRHCWPWAWTLLASVGGVAAGVALQDKSRLAHSSLYAASVVLFVAAMVIDSGQRTRSSEYISASKPLSLAAGISLVSQRPQADGTTVRLLRFDFVANPHLRLRTYDADRDDSSPYDNRNTTWLGQGLDFVLDKIRARDASRHRDVYCVFNAAYFGGLPDLVATHEAPIVADGKPLYDINTLKRNWPDQAWVFGEKVSEGRPRFVLRDAIPWPQLRQFQTALSGVRPLRVAAHSLALKPGMGNTTLRCSRTSLGWSADSRYLYVLIVRDPDGEGASNRQKRRGHVQTGGWNVRAVQQLWERLQVPYAILLDGGESTQLAYRTGANRYATVTAAYHLSYTLGYYRSRPLRLCLPMLPVAQNRGGVLNYLYVDGPSSARAGVE